MIRRRGGSLSLHPECGGRRPRPVHVPGERRQSCQHCDGHRRHRRGERCAGRTDWRDHDDGGHAGERHAPGERSRGRCAHVQRRDTAAQGAVVVTDASTGAFTYTPNAGAIGYDTFTYQVSDGGGVSTGTEMVFIVAASPRWPGQTVRVSVDSSAAKAAARARVTRSAQMAATSPSIRRRQLWYRAIRTTRSMCLFTIGNPPDRTREHIDRRRTG